MGCRLSKKDVVAVENKTDIKKKSRLTTKKKIAIGIIGAGALALIAFLVMVFVFDLGPVKEIKSSDEDARAVGEVAGFEVRYEELRYITLLFRSELDREMGVYSALSAEKKAEYESELEKRVNDEICGNYAVLSLCSDHGVDTDSKEANKYVKEAISELVDEIGGKKEYAEWLKENRLTDALLRSAYKAEYLEAQLLKKLFKKEDEEMIKGEVLDGLVSFIVEDESYVKVIHAYYPREYAYIDGWSEDMARERAFAALDLIRSAEGEDGRLDAMKSAIGKAPFVPGYSVTGSDYYITYGQMNEKYEDAAFALDEYGVSDVIELEEGYYIIMRVPKLRDEVAPRAYEFYDQYRYAQLKQICDERAEELVFNGNEYFKSLKLVDIE